MKLQIRGRSREQVGFVAACSVRKGGTGLELNYRGNNERTALSDGSNISYFVISTLFLGGPRREVNAGLGTTSALFSAWSGSGGRIRTGDQLVNSQLRYRCATPEHSSNYSDFIYYRQGEN